MALRYLGEFGRSRGPTASSQDVIRVVEKAYEERTDELLRLLYIRVADHLANEFEEIRRACASQLEVLASLAEVNDLDVPKRIAVKIREIAGRVAWRPAARAAVLALLEAGSSLARPLREAEPIEISLWIDIAYSRLAVDEFIEDSGLEKDEIAIALGVAARTVVGWPDLDTFMPISFRGTILTIASVDENVLLVQDAAMMLVPESVASPTVTGLPADIFVDFEPSNGSADFASEGEVEFAVVGATGTSIIDEGGLRLYELVNRLRLVETPLGWSHNSKDPGGSGEWLPNVLSGLKWDPHAIVVQKAGSVVLIKANVSQHGRFLDDAERL